MDLFDNIEIERYTQGHFGMFGGRLERVTLNCSIRLLDTMVDRFGTDNVLYSKGLKDNFFNVRVLVYVSDLFFGWLAGFVTDGIDKTSMPDMLKGFINDGYIEGVLAVLSIVR